VNILSVADLEDPSPWPVLSNGAIVVSTESIPNTGPLTLMLSGISANPTADASALQAAAVSIVGNGVSPSRISVTVTGNTATIVVDGNLAPVTPTTAPVPAANQSATNLTGQSVTFSDSIKLNSYECREYYFVVGDNVNTINLFVAIQSPISPGVRLKTYLGLNYMPSSIDFDCESPNITDNNEYQFTWTSISTGIGYFSGESLSLSKIETCQETLSFYGTWYASVCAGSTSLDFSFQVTLIQSNTPNNEPVSGISAVSTISVNFFLLNFMLLLHYVISRI